MDPKWSGEIKQKAHKDTIPEPKYLQSLDGAYKEKGTNNLCRIK